MIMSGASPIYAGIYQFTIVAMILARWRSCQST
jgi:ABC-type iron transport system FetAB permease component